MRKVRELRTLGHDIAQFVWDLMAFKPRDFEGLFPVKKRVVDFEGAAFPFMWACRIAGVGVVWDRGQQAELYGRDCNMDILMAHWPKRLVAERTLLTTVAACERALWADGRGGLHSEEWLADFDRWDRKRVSLLKVQHLICEHHPDLRNWSPTEGSPEVVLHPRAPGGRRLGGCVWTRETYQTRDGRLFLDF